MRKPNYNFKIPKMGQRVQVYTLPKIPEDFNKFLDDFSDHFIESEFTMAIQGGGNLKPERVKEKESEEKFGHGIKSKQEQSYFVRDPF